MRVVVGIRVTVSFMVRGLEFSVKVGVWGWQALLYVVRADRHSAEPGHVSVHRRTTQHLRHVRSQTSQEVPAV